MRKVYVVVTTRFVINADDGALIEDVINELDYSFVSTDGSVEIEDMEILNWHITDSK